MSRLLIIGTGGQAKVVLDCVRNEYDYIAFLSKDCSIKNILNYSVFSEEEFPISKIIESFDELVVAIGDNNVRLKMSLDYESKGMKLATVIHRASTVSEYAEIGTGTVVFANAVINPFTKIGKACIINTSAVIEHDCIIDDGVHISPNAAVGGACKIGEKAWICLGSSISNNICIGKNTVIGAGSTIITNVPDNVLMAGVPGVIKKRYG